METPRRHNVLLGLAALLAVASLARADWTLTTGDFTEQKNLKINTWDLSDGLSVTLESGKLQKIESRDVLALSANRPKAGVPGGGAEWKLNLRNGDLIFGAPAGIKGNNLEFTTAEMGIIAIPLKVVANIESTKPPEPGVAIAPPAADVADQDVVRFINNDRKEGLVADVNGNNLKLSVPSDDNANAVSEINMGLIERINFSGITPPHGIPPLSARIHFVSGSVLTVPMDAKLKSFAWSINDITLRDPAGKERKTTADSIASIDVTGGRVVCLTEIDPAKDEQTTFMGTAWPTRINKNVLGEPLKVLKTTYARGLGVHTRSDITYTLDGSFNAFNFRVGLDDSAAPQGAANVAVLLDGKVIWESKGLKAGGDNQLSPEVSLPIKGGKLLELRATPTLGGGKIDVRGRVDWLNVALVRP